MTPPTERVTPKEREWLEHVAQEHALLTPPKGILHNYDCCCLQCAEMDEGIRNLDALAEVLTKTKEACAKRQAGTRHMMVVMAQNRDGMLTIPEIETVFDDQPIRNLEITGE